MGASTALTDIGYRVDDGDIGYTGDSHLSFAFRALRSASLENPRPTPVGDAALASIKSILTTAKEKRPARQKASGRGLMEACV